MPSSPNTTGGSGEVVNGGENVDPECLDFSCHAELTLSSASQASDDILGGFFQDVMSDTATADMLDRMFGVKPNNNHMMEDSGTIKSSGENDNIGHFDPVEEGEQENEGRRHNQSSYSTNNVESGNINGIDDNISKQTRQEPIQVNKEGDRPNLFEPMRLNQQEEYNGLSLAQRSSCNDFIGLFSDPAPDTTANTMMAAPLSSHHEHQRRATVDSGMAPNLSQLLRTHGSSPAHGRGALDGTFTETESHGISGPTTDTTLIPSRNFRNPTQRSSSTRRRRATVDSDVAPSMGQLYGGGDGSNDSDVARQVTVGNGLQSDELGMDRVSAWGMANMVQGSIFGDPLQNFHVRRQTSLGSISAMTPEFSCLSNNNQITVSPPPRQDHSQVMNVDLGTAPTPSGPRHSNGSSGNHRGIALGREHLMETNILPFGENIEAPASPPIKPKPCPERRRRATMDSSLAPNLKELQGRIKDMDNLEELDQWIMALKKTKKLLSENGKRNDTPPKLVSRPQRRPQRHPQRRVTVDSGMAPDLGQLLGGDNCSTSSKDSGSAASHHPTIGRTKKKNLQFREAFQKLAESRKRTEMSRRQLEMMERTHVQPQVPEVAASAQVQAQQRLVGNRYEHKVSL